MNLIRAQCWNSNLAAKKIICKCLSEAVNCNIRVRFAPSPTGSLHIGGARTALYNWLYAKKTNGKFIIRVEDTDEARSTRESELSILNDLRWLNVNWDEGPDIGGPHAPYRQSERKDKYITASMKLLEEGIAYRCFDQEEKQLSSKVAVQSDVYTKKQTSRWRDASEAEIQQQISCNMPYTVKFKVPVGKRVVLQDRIFGEVIWDTDACLDDFIIMRSNGMPVYNFCVSVDDMDMQITHVIRAQEHLTNTLKQLLILEALGYTPPEYAHCSILLGSDGTKLSKRHGSASVHQFKSLGYLPEAIVNYLGNFTNNRLSLNTVTSDRGTSNSSISSDKQGKKKADSPKVAPVKVVYSVDEIVQAFSMEGILKGPAMFDIEYLKHINREHLRAMTMEEVRSIALAQLQQPPSNESGEASTSILRTNCQIEFNKSSVVELFLAQAIKIVQRDMVLTVDASHLVGNCLRYDLKNSIGNNATAAEIAANPSFSAVCRVLVRDFNSGVMPQGVGDDFVDRWKQYTHDVGTELGLKGKSLFQPLRLALTGCTSGPEIADQMRLVGLASTEEVQQSVLNPQYGTVTLRDRIRMLEQYSCQD